MQLEYAFVETSVFFFPFYTKSLLNFIITGSAHVCAGQKI